MVIEEAAGLIVPMGGMLHQSKISVPPASGVSRPRLVARVEAGAQGKLTVVSAPAGWGKSTLLAEWAARTSFNVAWVSLDEPDNDPVRFFRGVAAAIDHIHPLRMDDVLTLLRSPGPTIEDQLDGAILSHLEELPGQTAIVLDDFHVLTGQEQLRSIGRVLELMPSNIHFLVTTRGDVRIPLARLRAAGEVTILRAEDLAFSADEARALLNGRAESLHDDSSIRTLVERTEGWAAGIRLAGLAIAKHGDPQVAIERLRGTHRDISDYFREEILNRLDEDSCLFLVETSILDRFTESLATEVTGRPNARDLLFRVTASDFFLMPLDDERRWYRYHALFRDVLREDFDRLPGDRQRAIHQRASDWFEREGWISDAIEHALAADDTARVATLIDRYGDALLFNCGEANLLIRWIERLPEDSLRQNPGVVRVYAWALTTAGRIDLAARLLDRARADLDTVEGTAHNPNRREWEALLTSVQARVAAYRGDQKATITFGRRALELLDPLRQAGIRGDVELSMGFAHRALGDLDTATNAFAEAARLGRRHGNAQAARWGSRYGALTRLVQGRLRDAEAIIDEDLDELRSAGEEPGNTLAALLVTKAELRYERGDLAAVRPLLDGAIPIIQRVGDAKMLMNAYAALSNLLYAEGDANGAREKLRRAEDLFPSQVRGARIARLEMMLGNLDAALRWARNSGFALDDEADISRGEDEQATYARIVAQATLDDAPIGLLQRLIADAETGGRLARSLELHIVLARAYDIRGYAERAQVALCRAIEYARDEGFVQVFLNEGPDLQVLLRDLARDRHQVDEVTRRYILDLLTRSAGDTPASPSPDALPEPLTGRQLEILRLMADGRSNRDIASRLYIAEGTVKAHVHQITGKLMARNRTEAVATARSLHLLG